jgi:hypothetical protein
MHTRSRLAGTVVAVSLAVAGLFIAVPVASADGAASTTGVRVTFVSLNEVFRLYDTVCDGRPVYLEYKVNGGSTVRLRHSDGCGTHANYDRSMAEGAAVEYRGCVGTPESTVRCSSWTDDTA